MKNTKKEQIGGIIIHKKQGGNCVYHMAYFDIIVITDELFIVGSIY